jgi:hypothetical protein
VRPKACSAALSPDYAVELRLLDTHPMTYLSWTPPRQNEEVDRRDVVNPKQARALLATVRELAPGTEALFWCESYAATWPEECLHLREADFEPPAQDGGRGWVNLNGATVTVGAVRHAPGRWRPIPPDHRAQPVEQRVHASLAGRRGRRRSARGLSAISGIDGDGP